MGSTFGMFSAASADNFISDKQGSNLLQTDRQSPSIGQLRGIISHTIENPIIEYQSNKPSNEISDNKRDLAKINEMASSLEPRNSAIDNVVTGQSNRSMLFQKFDSSGSPMNHHQDYEKPNAKSLVSSIWEAIDLNPYPGE